jgi:quercetin dioxygenase-like cupin family protein
MTACTGVWTLAVVAAAGLTIGAQSATPTATHYPAAAVDESFAKSGTLLEIQNVRVMTATRTKAGEAEAHANDADIFHVLEGTATFIVGGTITGAHETAPGETRGTGLDGGEAYELKTGDVITIPVGIPHWFKSVQGPFRYYVVKVGVPK